MKVGQLYRACPTRLTGIAGRNVEAELNAPARCYPPILFTPATAPRAVRLPRRSLHANTINPCHPLPECVGEWVAVLGGLGWLALPTVLADNPPRPVPPNRLELRPTITRTPICRPDDGRPTWTPSPTVTPTTTLTASPRPDDARPNALDGVIVLITGNGMGGNHPDYSAGWDPGVCNQFAGPQASKRPNDGYTPLKCSPLWQAKQAAKALVSQLVSGRDRVAVVRFDFTAQAMPIVDNGNPASLLAWLDGDDANAVDAVSDSTSIYAALDSLTVFRTSNFPNRVPQPARAGPVPASSTR